MGLFSWVTQDTRRSVPSVYSERPTFEVTMTDNKDNKWVEEAYEGYGVFGGKDYYQLVAEMNRPELCNGDVDHDRTIGIGLSFGTSAIENKKTGEIYKSRGHDFFNWEDDKLPNGLSANDCIMSGKWVRIDIKEKDIIFPNLNEDNDIKWLDEEPETCEYQGYFYH